MVFLNFQDVITKRTHQGGANNILKINSHGNLVKFDTPKELILIGICLFNLNSSPSNKSIRSSISFLVTLL